MIQNITHRILHYHPGYKKKSVKICGIIDWTHRPRHWIFKKTGHKRVWNLNGDTQASSSKGVWPIDWYIDLCFVLSCISLYCVVLCCILYTGISLCVTNGCVWWFQSTFGTIQDSVTRKKLLDVTKIINIIRYFIVRHHHNYHIQRVMKIIGVIYISSPTLRNCTENQEIYCCK